MEPLKNFIKSPYLALTIVPLIWGSNFIIGKVLAGIISPFALTTGRFTVAFLTLLPIYLYNRKNLPPVKITLQVLLLLFVLGLTGIFGFNTLLYEGLKYTSPVNATLINALNPSLTVLLAFLVLKDKLNSGQILALACSFVGVAWIAMQGKPENLISLTFNHGDLVILFATLIWAIYTIGVKKVAKTMSPMVITIYSIFMGLMVLYPATYVELTNQPIGPLDWKSILAVFYLGIFPSVVAFWLWNRGIAQVGPGKAAMFYNLIPLFAAIMSYIFMSEHPSAYHLVGGALILLGVIWGTKPSRAKNRSF